MLIPSGTPRRGRPAEIHVPSVGTFYETGPFTLLVGPVALRAPSGVDHAPHPGLSISRLRPSHANRNPGCRTRAAPPISHLSDTAQIDRAQNLQPACNLARASYMLSPDMCSCGARRSLGELRPRPTCSPRKIRGRLLEAARCLLLGEPRGGDVAWRKPAVLVVLVAKESDQTGLQRTHDDQ